MATKTELHASDQTSAPDEVLAKPACRCPHRRAAATLGRRGQRGKRRGPHDKRRGPGEKRHVQKEKRRDQVEEKEGVTVKRTWSDGKRRWDKKHYCVFCRRPQVKIARHLLRKHADQQEVAAASMLPTGSKQRHLLLEHLRCRGNYLHNIEVIRQGNGEIVPWRQPSEEVDARNYLPCPLCLGFFLRADLWKHQASCRKKMTSDPSKNFSKTSDPMRESAPDPIGSPDSADDGTRSTEVTPSDPSGDTTDQTETKQTMTSDRGMDRNMTSDPGMDRSIISDPGAPPPRKRSRVQAAASRLLPISSGASESCSEVLHRMNQDHVSHQVKSDWLICKYGNNLMGTKDGSQRKYDYVSQKLRELGRVLLAAKSLDSSVQTLQDLLAASRLSLVLAAVRKASGYRLSRPPLSVKTTLKTVCEIAIGESLQDGDWEAAAKTTDFYHLLGREWDNLGLVNPDTAAPGGGAKLKKRSVPSRSEECTEPGPDHSDPRPEGLSQSSHPPLTSMIPPESRQQVSVSVPMVPRKARRHPWSSAEKEAIWRQLGVNVLVQSVPGKEVCQRCLDLEPVLRGRHWKDIKNQIHNQIQSQKKQQFHAQMDLQENQEQEVQNQKEEHRVQMYKQGNDHIQNQKKEQCHVQMDQQDQNKKKHQFHVEMDVQPQDDIHSQKKQQCQTQLGQQDHHQDHKKQLCHPRLDHQDHVQNQKKQLYQMDDQTTLDRDTSVLMGRLYGPDGRHRAPGQSLLEREPTTSPYPLPQRSMGHHMDQLLSRTEWTDESLSQHFSMSRNLPQDGPPGGPPADPHLGHIHF